LVKKVISTFDLSRIGVTFSAFNKELLIFQYAHVRAYKLKK